MIKRIIFDIDNTLIDFPKNYEVGYKKIIDKFNLNITAQDLYDVIDKYEKERINIYYSEKDLMDRINKEFNLNLNINFINEFFNMYNKFITPVSDEVKETLEYLNNKYELVTLSNWFTKSQECRLKEAGILKYFSKVYGADIVPIKPNKSSYMSVVDDLKPEECVMIGDSLENDIKIPFELGINVYHLNNLKIDKYPTISKIEELKEML